MTTDWKSEEDVKFKFLVSYLAEHGYKQECIHFNVSVDVQEGRKVKTIFADAVVYSSPKSESPLILCETKAPNEVLDRPVREQAISYARLLPRIVPLTLITNGSQVQVFQTVTKARLPGLPHRKMVSGAQQNSVNCEIAFVDGQPRLTPRPGGRFGNNVGSFAQHYVVETGRFGNQWLAAARKRAAVAGARIELLEFSFLQLLRSLNR